MLKHTLIEPEGILIIQPDAPLKSADFDDLAKEIDPFIAEHGKLPGLMIHAKTFPGWTSPDAFLAHIQFIKSHYRKVVHMAVVTDSILLAEVPKILSHLTDAQVKTFPASEFEDALQWLKAAIGA